MRVGVACERLPGEEGASALETVERVAGLGYDGVAFPSSRAVSATHDAAELDAVRDRAEELGLFLEVGIGRIVDASGGEDADELAARFAAAVRLGSTEITGYTTLDRFHPVTRFSTQLGAVVVTMRRLADLAEESGVHVNLESHEDLSSFDVLEVLELVGSPAVGVNLDLANVVVRGEDPLEATARLAPHVRQTQLEDFRFALVRDGLHRQLAACGDGLVDWDRVVEILRAQSPCRTLCVEQHRGQFGLDLFEADWLRAHPSLPAEEPLGLLAQVLRSGASMAEPEVARRVRSDEELSADLDRSVAVLRAAVAQLSP